MQGLGDVLWGWVTIRGARRRESHSRPDGTFGRSGLGDEEKKLVVVGPLIDGLVGCRPPGSFYWLLSGCAMFVPSGRLSRRFVGVPCCLGWATCAAEQMVCRSIGLGPRPQEGGALLLWGEEEETTAGGGGWSAVGAGASSCSGA